MNNTHTSGQLKDNRKNGALLQFRSGINTPSGNILEKSLRSLNNSLDASKISE